MKTLVNIFRALGEDTRYKIVKMLLEEEKCICELMEDLNLSQSAVSHHVKILKQAELVSDRRQGKWTFYSLDKEGFESAFAYFQKEMITPIEGYQYKMKVEPEAKCLS